MKLHFDSDDSSLRITAYDTRSVLIGEREVSSTFVITPQSLLIDLPAVAVGQLTWEILSALHDLELEVLLVGTGTRQQFPGSDFYAELASRRIGLEAMTSAAACRTFNILAAENRRVAALITFDQEPR